MEPAHTQPVVYAPMWMDGGGYQDKCPIDPRVRVHTPYECRCRPQRALFSTNTEFSQHIKNKYHRDWIQNYHRTVCEDLELLNVENKGLKREMAILYGKLEKGELRWSRDVAEHVRLESSLKHANRQLSEKIESLESRILSLVEDNVILRVQQDTVHEKKYSDLQEKFDAFVEKHQTDTLEHARVQEELKRVIATQRETMDQLKKVLTQ